MIIDNVRSCFVWLVNNVRAMKNIMITNNSLFVTYPESV